MAISFTPTKIARFVGALYGVALNNSTYAAATTEIYARGFDAVANEVFAADFGTKTTAQVAATVVANLGLTGAAATEGAAYVEGQLNAAAANARGAVIMNVLNLFAGLTSDVTYGAAATAFEARVANAIIYSGATTSVYHGAFTDLSTGTAFNLTTGFDNLVGTSGADIFNAYEQNADTLGTGDIIDGKGGDDVLFADIHTSIHGGIAPRTTSVEKAIFRVQHDQTDSGDNNIAGTGIIDAERMSGTNIYEDNNSRADLVIEDVRIGASQKTKDITIIMRDTDPGAVDYAVYFDQNSLRNVSSSSSSINVRVLDTYSVASGTAELKDSPYGSFTFWYSSDAGVTYTKVELASQAMQDAQSITDMVAALQIQADAAFGAGIVTVAKGGAYSVPDSVTGNTVTSNEITLSTNAAISFDTTRAGSGWKATDTVPAISGLYTSYNTTSASSTDLVTSTVILDHVGRGSNGGDLIIGGLSTGATSASRGVQQFDITVQDSSKLSNILSTNNTLQVVNIVNGTTDVQSDAYVTRTTNAGDLYVGVSNDQNSDLVSGPQNYEDSAYGFSDVRVINGASMTGKLNFTAQMTSAAVAKYLNLVDTANSPSADNIAVTYSGGTNADSMTVDLDSATLASRSNILVGREDFTFTFNGNAEADIIDVAVDRGGDNLITAGETAMLGNAEYWYTNQKLNANLSINGGDGNDTIRTPGAGDKIIDGGTGNDTIYTDNTGALGDGAGTVISAIANGNTISAPRSVWVLNTSNQSDVGGGYVLAANEDRSLADLQSSANTLHALYKATVTVTFKGLTATKEIASTNYITSDLQINQAIKSAVNSDAVLSKLIIAQDGPANTLVITSLIDGLMANTDLGIAVTAADATTFTAADITALSTAWAAADAGTNVIVAPNLLTNVVVANAAAADTGAEINALFATEVAAFTGTSGDDYYQQQAETGAGGSVADTALVGAESIATTDNTVTGGTGDDVMVLSTTGEATADAAFGAYTAADQAPFSNEIIKYTAAFGNDVIVNFRADTDAGVGQFSAGYDVLDFTGMGGNLNTTGSTFNNAVTGVGLVAALAVNNGSIWIEDLVTTDGVASDNDSADNVKELFTEGVTAATVIYIAVAATNVGTVYKVVDGTGAADLTVTAMGTIDLADTGWGTLTAGNFF
jgi:hypothetical protein